MSSNGFHSLNVETLDEDPKEMVNTSENVSLNTTGISSEKSDLEKREDLLYDDKVYGVNIKIKNPWRIGKVFAFCYFKNHPLIVIGPDCKILY
jgi:hypothetical protein